ncbi:hypothetical protein [Parasphingorhabdus pacifica]
MEQLPRWLPNDGDPARPSAARWYAHFLAGAHDFAVDQGLARGVNYCLSRDEPDSIVYGAVGREV